ncbi:polysaccharide biosynthesis protein [Bacillus sonorensis]|uniref:Polysaccharide biosynthesis protein n=1 Tax=Bacillus sonorensis L12 TaxID=1274524 RepID=M5P9X9_9BACI|nr:polysaccharide biosynthesis protein [Bacillus sonorensis]TWK82311.1 UDP-N-acetylglucosamine 4,6-dehydratase (inverting) [Bacillus paralicheniformis]EME76258.1 polysaccharide biosynthesis protein [Bacillus sonorensis L12]MBG9915293.1 UDP-N-acetylglucosamine 4,6-dehydratase [Bacillus sonorensis]MCF7618283.1 polysaccharide biosynthesis protein [Bacillus sonorensis]MCY7857003.1 polysaccharide biosynthesis protein [Bacillus sonorensis]
MFENKVIFITGGTGSWGHELILQLLSLNPKKIIVFSRNEERQVQMRREIEDPRLTFYIGDIRDRKALASGLKGVDYVFHLAALKHVPVCEEQPLEALKTNVTGTENVIEAAIENGVKKVINVSTDKAADPVNFYGMTKAIGEKLIIYANHLNSETAFICVRGGNVLGSSGSVLQLFKDQIRQKNQVSITDKRMTRFFLTKEKTIQLLLKAAVQGIGGEIFIMNSPACRILDMAEVLIEAYGSQHTSIIESGARPGEKLHELLISAHERQHAVSFTDDLSVVLPSIKIPELHAHYAGYGPLQTKKLSSNDFLISKKEVKEMLKEGGFLA